MYPPLQILLRPSARSWRILKGCISATLMASAALGLSAHAADQRQFVVSPFSWMYYPAKPSTRYPAPVAIISADKISNLGDAVDLNGANSTAASGRTLTYAWKLNSQPKGSKVKLSNVTQRLASFVSDKAGNYKVSLVVNDGLKSSTAATADINVLAPVGQKGIDRAPIRGAKLAVFVVDFPDTPDDLRAMQPSISTLREALFGSLAKGYLSDMSYGQFSTLTADIFGPVRMNQPGFNTQTVQPLSYDTIMDEARFTIPGFDPAGYDGMVLIPLHDAYLEAAWVSSSAGRMNVNGSVQQFKMLMYLPVCVGYYARDRTQAFFQFDSLYAQGAITGPTTFRDFTITTPGTQAQKTFLHEFGHFLGLMTHALSRTNGTSFDYQPEVPNNYLVANDPWSQSLLNFNYGNRFDILGANEFSMNLNHVFRNYLGWHNSSNLKSIRSPTLQTVTIHPSHATSGVRALEVRVPYKYGYLADSTQYKNQGFFLEVHSPVNRWDASLAETDIKGNSDGIFVNKTDGFTPFLLDMSPSANIPYYGVNIPDIRDVVLKPGMVYDNGEVRFSNVRKNADGSFTLDVRVY